MQSDEIETVLADLVLTGASTSKAPSVFNSDSKPTQQFSDGKGINQGDQNLPVN